MDYRQQTDLVPTREVSIFILKNKKWIDVFSGEVSFVYDFAAQEFRCVFTNLNLAKPHVYRLQPKIRRKGPKAFVVRAVNVSAGENTHDCILAFRFESSTDSFNFQYFMEHQPEFSNQQSGIVPGSSMPPVSNNRTHRLAQQHGRAGSLNPSNSIQNKRNLSVRSQMTPSIDGSVRSREIPQVNIVPLTEENLLLHDAIHRPRSRRVGDVLKII